MQSYNAMVASIILRAFIANSAVVLYYAFFAHIWYRTPLLPRRIGLCMLILFSSYVATHFLIGLNAPTYIITVLVLLLISRILWKHLTGVHFWICFILCAVSEFILEFICEMVFVRLVPDTFAINLGRSYNYVSPLASLPVLFFVIVFVLGLALLVFKLIVERRENRERVISGQKYLFRLIALFLLMLVIMILIARNYDNSLKSDGVYESTLNAILKNSSSLFVSLLATVLLLFYLWQNIQQYRLYLNNQSLQDKNSAYQRVLDSTREFRHNISNMIYGFEGVILSGDMDAVKKYYDEMSRRCLLTNNENADALNHIRDASIVSLLLRKLDTAAKKEIPVYLSSDPAFSFGGLPSARLVEIMGVLIDNAIEAAAGSAAPRVNVTLSGTDDYNEIIISNTYADDADLSFLSGEAVSSKPGHRAAGLASVHKALQRYPNICFNQYIQGRYVESSLCDYKTAAK